jgi:hypothetical protein
VPDERVAAAIAHWAPRFVTNGVDMNDFQTVTGSVETWEEWLPAWRTNGDMHAGLAREAEEAGRRARRARRGTAPRSPTTSGSSSGCST